VEDSRTSAKQARKTEIDTAVGSAVGSTLGVLALCVIFCCLWRRGKLGKLGRLGKRHGPTSRSPGTSTFPSMVDQSINQSSTLPSYGVDIELMSPYSATPYHAAGSVHVGATPSNKVREIGTQAKGEVDGSERVGSGASESPTAGEASSSITVVHSDPFPISYSASTRGRSASSSSLDEPLAEVNGDPRDPFPVLTFAAATASSARAPASSTSSTSSASSSAAACASSPRDGDEKHVLTNPNDYHLEKESKGVAGSGAGSSGAGSGGAGSGGAGSSSSHAVIEGDETEPKVLRL